MIDILSQYVIFLVKFITILLLPLSILIIVSFNIKYKNKKYIRIKNINEEYVLLQEEIYKNINDKSTYKRKKNILKKNYNNFKKVCNKNLFVLNFNNDINAKDTKILKEVISLILLVANKNDEVLLKLNSSGGFINNYGLAAAHFKRLKKNVKLIVSVDLIAASGGYLIASVADEIIASDFAIIGSIGVISVVPNFNKIITKNNIDIEHHTAGKYKSTLNIIGKNTEHGRAKFIASLNRAHFLFKNFLKENRPNLDIDKISTGEYWYAKDAIHLNLIDAIKTADQYILERIDDINIYEIEIKKNIKFKEKIIKQFKTLLVKLLVK